MKAVRDRPRNLQQELGKLKAFGFPEQEASLNLARTHALISRDFNQLFKAHGISDPQYNALHIVAAAGRDGVLSETIGARMVTHDPDTTRLIDQLVKADLVRRSRSTEDRRCVCVSITPEGRRLLHRVKKKVHDLHRRQLGHLGRKQLEQLSRLLFLVRHP